MVLFFTGHAHAGQNLTKVLAHRAKELEPPMQMCDALAANVSAEFATVLSNCLGHGRRLFVDVVAAVVRAAIPLADRQADRWADQRHRP